MRISDWSSDVCSSDLAPAERAGRLQEQPLLQQGCRQRRPHGPVRGLDQGELEDVALGVAAAERIGAGAHWQQQVGGAGVVAPSEGMDRADRRQPDGAGHVGVGTRLEEHTYELQSQLRYTYAVFCSTKN